MEVATMTTSTTSAIQPRELVPELMARTRWSTDQLAAHQRRRLDALLRHAVTASPFHRRRLGADPTGAELAELPTMSKATLMACFDEIITDRRLSRAAAQTHLEGPSGEEPLHGHLVFSTSGSTGEPGIFVTKPEEFVPWVAALMRTMTLFGVTPGMRIGGLGAASGRHISRHLVAGLVAGRPTTAPPTSVATPLSEIVTAFNAYQPEVIPGYPSLQALLAQEQLAGRLHITPRVIPYAGEVLTPDMHAQIRAAWGVEPYSMYSTTEAGMIASDCPARVGMHLWEDLALIEVVDEYNRPVPPGVPGHHVLLTNLVNRTQPLIRYEITDLITLAEGPNPTGMPFRRITSIHGRSDDIAELPARAGGTIAVPPHQLRAPVSAIPGLRQYQIVVSDTGLRVTVVRGADAPHDTPQRIEAALHCALLDAGVASPPITVNCVESIPREPGHANKYQTMKVERSSSPRSQPPASGTIGKSLPE
jgi:phenylacetate-coenzyme A ligase PaaK-like adenylate-forming protein